MHYYDINPALSHDEVVDIKSEIARLELQIHPLVREQDRYLFFHNTPERQARYSELGQRIKVLEDQRLELYYRLYPMIGKMNRGYVTAAAAPVPDAPDDREDQEATYRSL